MYPPDLDTALARTTGIIGAMTECSSTEVLKKNGKQKASGSLSSFHFLFLIILTPSTTAVSWNSEGDQINNTFDLYYNKVQNDVHKNPFQYKSLIKLYQFNNSIRISLKVKILFKCIAYIMYIRN